MEAIERIFFFRCLEICSEEMSGRRGSFLNSVFSKNKFRTRLCDVQYLKPGETFTIREKKTRKKRPVALNEATYEAIQNYLRVRPETSPDAPLFLSRTGHEKALTVSSLNALVKKWGKEAGIRENLGSHSQIGRAHV